MTSTAAFVLFPLAMAFAAFSDLFTMTIPNRVPIALALGFCLMAVLTGMPAVTVGLHVAMAFGCLAVAFGCFAAGWMGGGDAKLLAATALWFGPTAVMAEYALDASVYGGALTLGILALRLVLRPVTNVAFVDRLLERKTGIPYGIALGLAGLTTYPSSPWLDAAVSGWS